jgi:hypothetical protein
MIADAAPGSRRKKKDEADEVELLLRTAVFLRWKVNTPMYS